MCAAWGGVGGKASFWIFYFSLSQNDRNTEFFYFYRKWYSVTLLKPEGKEKIKCFGNRQFSFRQQLPLSCFHICCLGSFFFSWSIVRFPPLYTDFSSNYESLSVWIYHDFGNQCSSADTVSVKKWRTWGMWRGLRLFCFWESCWAQTPTLRGAGWVSPSARGHCSPQPLIAALQAWVYFLCNINDSIY